MWPIYLLLQNFGWAILIFTIIVKLAMLPLSIKQQKNMAYSQLFAPKVKEIQRKYRDNRDKQAEELQKLQAQGYNPTGGCGPLVLTMLLLFGVIDVVYKPMTHMEHISSGDITQIVNVATQTEYANIFLNEFNKEDMIIIEAYKKDPASILISEANPVLNHPFVADEEYKTNYSSKDPQTISNEQRETYGKFSAEQLSEMVGDTSRLSVETKQRIKAVATKYSSLQKELMALQVYNKHPEAFNDSGLITDAVKGQLANLSKNMMFFGINLGDTPTMALNIMVLIPVLSFVFSLAQTLLTQYFNKKNSPETADAGGAGMKVMLYIMPLFSLWIAFNVPAGVGFYWAISYAVGIIQSIALQKICNPAKLREAAEIEFKKKTSNTKVQVTTTAVVKDAETGEDKVVEKKESLSQKELNRRKLAAARKADAEKYGEEYKEDDD